MLGYRKLRKLTLSAIPAMRKPAHIQGLFQKGPAPPRSVISRGRSTRGNVSRSASTHWRRKTDVTHNRTQKRAEINALQARTGTAQAARTAGSYKVVWP